MDKIVLTQKQDEYLDQLAWSLMYVPMDKLPKGMWKHAIKISHKYGASGDSASFAFKDHIKKSLLQKRRG